MGLAQWRELVSKWPIQHALISTALKNNVQLDPAILKTYRKVAQKKVDKGAFGYTSYKQDIERIKQALGQ